MHRLHYYVIANFSITFFSIFLPLFATASVAILNTETLRMKLLTAFPLILPAWALLIFAYQSYNDAAFGGMLFSWPSPQRFAMALRRYKGVQKETFDKINAITVNTGLLPLVYANLLLSPIVLQGNQINDSGMVYVLVLIYAPFLYAESVLVQVLGSRLMKRLNAAKHR